MSTILAFLLILLQTLAAIIGYVKPYPELFDLVVTYGSPPALFMRLLNHAYPASDASMLLPAILLFHVIKYLSLSRSQMVTERATLHYTSILLEVGYLFAAFRFLF